MADQRRRSETDCRNRQAAAIACAHLAQQEEL